MAGKSKNMMRKILDITPPNKGEIDRPSASSTPQKRRVTATVFLIGGGLVLIGSLAYVFIESKAEIEIWPQKERVEFQAEAGSIPIDVFKTEKALSEEFAATGLKLKAEKAKGVIRIYNEYSSSPQVLVATTRFISNEGKLFRTPVKIVVPGMPGTIDIEVVADQPGEEHNIGPSTFSIPGFAGTPKYTLFYAKSFESMAGGVKKEVLQITLEDLDKSENSLRERALRECQISLEAAVPPENIFIKEAGECFVKDFSSSAKAGQEADKFSSQIKAEGKILTFMKSEMENFVKNYIRSKIGYDKEVDGDSLEIGYSPKTIDLKTEKIVLSLKI